MNHMRLVDGRHAYINMYGNMQLCHLKSDLSLKPYDYVHCESFTSIHYIMYQGVVEDASQRQAYRPRARVRRAAILLSQGAVLWSPSKSVSIVA